jgi:flavoprotein
MGAKTTRINPICWAVTGNYNGLKFDGINVLPNLESEKILFTLSTDSGEVVKLCEVKFQVQDHTETIYYQIARRVVGNKVSILL